MPADSAAASLSCDQTSDYSLSAQHSSCRQPQRDCVPLKADMHVDSTAARLTCDQTPRSPWSAQRACCAYMRLGSQQTRTQRGIAWNSRLVMQPVPAPVASASSSLRYASCLRLQPCMQLYTNRMMGAIRRLPSCGTHVCLCTTMHLARQGLRTASVAARGRRAAGAPGRATSPLQLQRAI